MILEVFDVEHGACALVTGTVLADAGALRGPAHCSPSVGAASHDVPQDGTNGMFRPRFPGRRLRASTRQGRSAQNAYRTLSHGVRSAMRSVSSRTRAPLKPLRYRTLRPPV